jgi:hypothetical protein
MPVAACALATKIIEVLQQEVSKSGTTTLYSIDSKKWKCDLQVTCSQSEQLEQNYCVLIGTDRPVMSSGKSGRLTIGRCGKRNDRNYGCENRTPLRYVADRRNGPSFELRIAHTV